MHILGTMVSSRLAPEDYTKWLLLTGIIFRPINCWICCVSGIVEVDKLVPDGVLWFRLIIFFNNISEEQIFSQLISTSACYTENNQWALPDILTAPWLETDLALDEWWWSTARIFLFFFFLEIYLDAVKICLELVHMALMGLSWPLTSPMGVKLSTFHTFSMPPRQPLSSMGRPGTYARAHTQSLWALGICCGVKAERHDKLKDIKA